MKSLFRIVGGIVLAGVLLELLVLLAGRFGFAAAVTEHLVAVAAVVLLFSLYLTFIRRKIAELGMERVGYFSGSTDKLGQPFQHSDFWDPICRRVTPVDALLRVRKYRTGDGRILYTVGRRSLRLVRIQRTIVALVIIYLVLAPWDGLYRLNKLGGPLGEQELTRTQERASGAGDSPLSGILQPIQTTAADATHWFGTHIPLFSRNPYRLPSDERLLMQEDVEGYTLKQLQSAINTLYARHGYYFAGISNPEDAAYFAKQDWYEADESLSTSDVEARFSDVERDNWDFLVERRKVCPYLLPTASRSLTEQDVEGYTLKQLRSAVNTLYARHQVLFKKSSADGKYFRKQDWYAPVKSQSKKDARGEFSYAEAKNYAFLVEKRTAHPYSLPSSERQLNANDIKGYGKTELQSAINTLYARHHYRFDSQKNKKDAAYFASQRWYQPEESISMSDAKAAFSEMERKNYQYLLKQKKAKE